MAYWILKTEPGVYSYEMLERDHQTDWTGVRNFQARNNLREMKQGDILVTQTTDPEMMLALRKASAAITDIGGMLSHTAITARELNIPCIVDTKFATQRLRDGDEVEVDTEKGIVRILKRAQK
jgi:pyruvate,water dikinase